MCGHLRKEQELAFIIKNKKSRLKVRPSLSGGMSWIFMSTRPHPESARIIREARQATGLTQLELAEKLGVTIGTIGCYERGAGMPKTDNLFALCDILHIRPADLLRADS